MSIGYPITAIRVGVGIKHNFIPIGPILMFMSVY